jgi:microcin C transport system substrate-binding protein
MHGDAALAPGFDHWTYTDPAAPKGGTLRYAVTGTFDTLNPHVVKGVPAAGLGYTYESLMVRSWDEPFTLYGLIAERADLAPDRSGIVFHLNPKARWHDGTPILADDVLFSEDVLKRLGTPNRRQFYERVRTTERIDDRTVRFVLAPDADGRYDRELPLILGLMPIHQKAYWQGRAFEKTTLEPPMGSGPYRIASVEPWRRIVYERVRGHWAADLPVRKGLYNVDRIVFDYYRDDAVALEAFKAGEADIRREADPVKWATGYDGPALAEGRIVKLELPHHRPEYARGLVFNERRALFRDARVRRALGLTTDFAWIARTFYHDAVVRTASYYPNSELAATGVPEGREREILEGVRKDVPPGLFDRPYEPPSGDARSGRRAAFELLAQAGWRLDGGRLKDAQGQPFAFEILLGDPSDERVAMEFARGLDRLGVGASVRTVDSAQYQSRVENFDYDMTIRAWISTLSPGNEQLYYFGSSAADQPGSRNYPGIRDPAVDALAGALGRAETRGELVTTVRALDRVLLWGDHMIPLFHTTADRLAVSARLRRPAVTPLYGAMPEAWWDANGE